MAFLVIADPPQQFAAWLTNEQQPAAEPTDPAALAGLQAIMRPSCIGCHTIRGTPAAGHPAQVCSNASEMSDASY